MDFYCISSEIGHTCACTRTHLNFEDPVVCWWCFTQKVILSLAMRWQ